MTNQADDTPEVGAARADDDHGERLAVLEQLESWLERPMQVLGFVWLALLILELTRGLSPFLATLSTIIWIAFILDFAVRFTLAPAKGTYLRRNWLAALSLLVPALRVLRVARAVRVLRAARAIRGARLVRVVASLNRGMRSLSASMGRRGLGYVVVLTILVALGGAAGMYAFESGPGGGLPDYGTALRWTAMVMTTLGSDYWPGTAEGRTLCFLLAVYAFAVWGYITASLATFFVGRDAEDDRAELAGQQSIEGLRREIAALRAELRPRETP
jgi:voltage-gated potassium channel